MNEPTNETTNEPSNAKERAKPWMYLADTYAIVSFVSVCVCETLVDDIKFNICRDPVIALIKWVSCAKYLWDTRIPRYLHAWSRVWLLLLLLLHQFASLF